MSTNPDDNNNFRCTDGIYGLLVLAMLTASSSTVTLFPMNNVIEKPDYWYEIIFASSGAAFFVAGTYASVSSAVLMPFKKHTATIMVDLFATFKITEIVAYGLIHLIWSRLLGYFEPFPRRSQLIIYLSVCVCLVRFWILIPLEKRTNPFLRKKYQFFIGRYSWGSFITMQLLVMSKVFGMVSIEFQWLIALLVPLKKEINSYIIQKLTSRSALPEKLIEAKFIGKISVSLCYSFWLAIILSNGITKTTEFVLLGMNFFINILLCCNAIRLHKHVGSSELETGIRQSLKEQAITELILNEVMEFIVPIAFIGSLSFAYFGPNKNILGNIGCSIWKYRKVEDFWSSIIPVGEMALIDCVSLIVSGILLWRFCNIQLANEYCRTMKKYWVHMVFTGGIYVSGVSERIDATFKKLTQGR